MNVTWQDASESYKSEGGTQENQFTDVHFITVGKTRLGCVYRKTGEIKWTLTVYDKSDVGGGYSQRRINAEAETLQAAKVALELML